MSGLEVRQIHKVFNGHTALEDVSFEAGPGEIVAVLGPSGSGKSTLLNCVAGLESPDSGDVCWEGQSWLDVPVHLRRIGLVFQDYQLFPHLSVAENVAYGLRRQEERQPGRWNEEAIRERIGELLGLVGLPGAEKRQVTTLSGGEQQRVAIARALAPRPQLILLDEPFGALDRLLRERLLDELGSLLRQVKQTTLYVTHDQEEAFALADRLVLLSGGRLIQQGTPGEVYANPASEGVARFLGLDNLIPARVRRTAGRVDELISALGTFAIPHMLSWPEGHGSLLLRPDAARITGQSAGNGLHISGRVEGVRFFGARWEVNLVTQAGSLRFWFPGGEGLPGPGEQVKLTLHWQAGVHFYPAA